MTQPKQPVYLDLSKIRLPVTAIVSILHRISGFFLACTLPLILFVAQYAVTSESHFVAMNNCAKQSLLIQMFILSFFLAYGYHVLAGIRHLIMDFGCGLSKTRGKQSAIFLLAVYFLLVLYVLWSFLWA